MSENRCQWSIRFCDDSVFLLESNQWSEVDHYIWVELNLVNDGFVLRTFQDNLKVLGPEIANTDALQLSLRLEVLKDFPTRL
ncbi:hypothetical protein BD779DRAFT_1553182 [Infundibulicybe gibba]|nr:hypothetical protein BD779DRAFT_1553182 [Infundibulicybe gibba]